MRAAPRPRGEEEGAPPPVDLIEERENGDVVRTLIAEGLVTAAHDVSDGGLLVAIAEMAMASGIGAALEPVPEDTPAHAFWFGEDQARYVVAVADGAAFCRAAQLAGVPALPLGRSGGEALVLPGGETISVARLSAAHEATLPALMA